MSLAEKKIVAYHEAGHALVGWLLEHTDALLKVTIVPRTKTALGYALYNTSDQKLYSKEELLDIMCMALGGKAAEAIAFNSVTSGAQSDLRKVTKIAYAQVRVFGMSSAVGLMSYSPMRGPGRIPYSRTLQNLIDLEVRQIIGNAYYRTETLLRDNRDKLTALAEELLKKETMTFNDVQDVLGPPLFPKKGVDPTEFENTLKNMEKAANADDGDNVGASSSKPGPQHGG